MNGDMPDRKYALFHREARPTRPNAKLSAGGRKTCGNIEARSSPRNPRDSPCKIIYREKTI